MDIETKRRQRREWYHRTKQDPERYARMREVNRLAQERRHARDPRARGDAQRKYRYGLDAAGIARLLSDQLGLCAMCGGQLGLRSHIDHDHRTGVVRGILHQRCNAGLGYFEDPEWVAQALAYMRR